MLAQEYIFWPFGVDVNVLEMVAVTPPRLGLGLVKDSLPAAAQPKPERAGHPKPKQLAMPSVTYSVDGVLVMITNE
jgi:hypothetical protein